MVLQDCWCPADTKISLARDKLTTSNAHTRGKAKASLTHLYLLLTTAGNSKGGFNLTKALGSVVASILLHPPFSILPKESPQHSKEENRLKRSDCLNMGGGCLLFGKEILANTLAGSPRRDRLPPTLLRGNVISNTPGEQGPAAVPLPAVPAPPL